MTWAAIAYVVAGAWCMLRWGGLDARDHYAVAGITPLGRVLGTMLVPLLIVALWPFYWRARRLALSSRQNDAVLGGRLVAGDPFEPHS